MLPIICAEREKGQVGAVFHVADLEILEAIADGDRFLNLRTDNHDGFVPIAATWLPEVSGLCRMEHFVLAGNLETLHLFEWCICIVIVLQMNVNRDVLDGHILV